MQELQNALQALHLGTPVALVSVLEVGGSTPRSSGARMVVCADGRNFGTIGGGEVEHQVIQRAHQAIQDRQPVVFQAHLTRDLGMCCGGDMKLFIDPIHPPQTLHVYGAGHVAHAVVPMAEALGFSVTVIDDRDDLNTPDRFACSRVLTSPLEHARAQIAPRHVLIVTHDHALDLELCQALLPQPVSWIGMIGSRAKMAKFRVRLRAAGLTEETIDTLSSPVGLALGSETPAEIAVSIAAEWVAHRRGPTE